MGRSSKKDEAQTVTVEDLHGNELEVPVGIDGKSPVSPNNPHPKAVAPEDREAAEEARKAELKFAEALADVSDAGGNAASTNKEDNNPGVAEVDKSKQQTGTNADTKK